MKWLTCFFIVVVSLSLVMPAYCDEPEYGWKNEIALGYTQKTGNTENEQLNASYEGLRKRETDEFEESTLEEPPPEEFPMALLCSPVFVFIPISNI